MKVCFLPVAAVLACVPAEATTAYRIDFGPLGSSSKYITPTKQQGWNNVALANEQQTEPGAASFMARYYGENEERESAVSQAVLIYDVNGKAQPVSLAAVKSGSGTLRMLGGSGAAYAPDSLYEKFQPGADLTGFPPSAHRDFITVDGGGSLTLTFSGLQRGTYDLTLAAGRTYASGGSATEASYAVNGETRTLRGNDGSGGGQYAGVLAWKSIDVGEDGTLTLTIEGCQNTDTGKWTSAALNSLELTLVPEPSPPLLAAFGALAFVFCRRRP